MQSRISSRLRKSVCLIAGAAMLVAGAGSASAAPPGPELTFLPGPGGLKVDVHHTSGVASWCTYTADWFVAPPFRLGANDTFPLLIPGVPDNRDWNVNVKCDNGAVTNTVFHYGDSGTPAPVPAPGPGPVRTVTDSTFATNVLQNANPVLVAFQKPTCVDCTNVDPVLSDVAAESNVVVYTLDAELNPATPAQFGIITPPCPDCGTFISPMLVLFSNGVVIDKIKVKNPDGSLITKAELLSRLPVG